MNSVILDELYKNLGKYIASDTICKQLNISRIAVWNRIKGLQKIGYKIEAKRSVGYKLTQEGNDILIPYEIRRRLSTEFFGKSVEYFRLTSSTMDEAQYLIEKGCPNGTLVISEEQTSGRGRQKRKWLSPKGVNIYASLVYKPYNMSAIKSIELMFAVSVAVVEALSDFGIDNANIKWPNDVIVNYKKIAGVLVETKSESGILKSAVLGFGVNVNMEDTPDDIDNAVTSIYLEVGHKIDRTQLLVNILYYLENLVSLIETDKESKILELWRNYDMTIGKRVLIISSNEKIKGTAEDIDKNGFLIVKTDKGELKKVVTADSVRFLNEK